MRLLDQFRLIKLNVIVLADLEPRPSRVAGETAKKDEAGLKIYIERAEGGIRKIGIDLSDHFLSLLYCCILPFIHTSKTRSFIYFSFRTVRPS